MISLLMDMKNVDINVPIYNFSEFLEYFRNILKEAANIEEY